MAEQKTKDQDKKKPTGGAPDKSIHNVRPTRTKDISRDTKNKS